MFRAVLIERDEAGYRSQLKELDEAQLPPGDVTVRITHSTLNYKDALAITGRGRIVRDFPMVPGIDFAGTVESSDHPDYRLGDAVLLNGWGVGESHWGGLAEKARVDGDWLLPLPQAFSPHQSMAIGTAGYTAMLSIMALERQGVTPERGDILVTGASGGVGSFAIMLLATLGYRVIASTGRVDEREYLQRLGAADVIDRQTLAEPGRPLEKARWAGAIDSVGSHTLAGVCAGMQRDGVVAACGLAQGMDFPATVAPFILRGVTLVGIDSAMRAREDRITAWQRLATTIDPQRLNEVSQEIGLTEVIDTAADLIDGRVRGRRVVRIDEQ